MVEPQQVTISHHKLTGLWITEERGLRKVAMDTLICCDSRISWKGTLEMYQKALAARQAWVDLLATLLPAAAWGPHQLALWTDEMVP